MLPALSVVTPSLNQARFIEASIRSVLDQKYSTVEHIIVDGGSTDGTLDILRRYPHLRWISEPDRGQGHAVNKGFGMATGDIIGWLNSDDRYCAGAFDMVAGLFEEPEVQVVCGDGYRIDEEGRIQARLASRYSAPGDLIRYWWWRYGYVHPSFFFRKSVLAQTGMIDETLNYALDVDFLIRLGLRYKFYYLPEPVACLRVYPGSKTGRGLHSLIPGHIREMQRVSYRYWGRPTEISYYRNGASFVAGLFWSLIKNVCLVPGSKLHAAIFRRTI